MAAIDCKLFSHSLGPHIEQLYTGFGLLHEAGLIAMSQETRAPPRGAAPAVQYLRNAEGSHLRVEMRSASHETSVLFFDAHDAKEISTGALHECDHYFKRSYSRSYVREAHRNSAHKIHPLGLNYLVFADGRSRPSLQRNLALARSARETMTRAMAALDTGNRFRFHPRLRDLHALPSLAQEPRVLFMATAYDPCDVPDRPPEKIEERIRTNEFRANCIRLLRTELGPRFYGGFEHNAYTTTKYRDALLDDPAKARKRNYLKILAQFPICVATTGLHGSIGWKFAEYVAFSKAIVSERLHYDVPGNLQPGHNYLQISSPEDCVDQCLRLMADGEMRERLMLNNCAYYQHYVRPDMLVLNAILTALGRPHADAAFDLHAQAARASAPAVDSPAPLVRMD